MTAVGGFCSMPTTVPSARGWRRCGRNPQTRCNSTSESTGVVDRRRHVRAERLATPIGRRAGIEQPQTRRRRWCPTGCGCARTPARRCRGRACAIRCSRPADAPVSCTTAKRTPSSTTSARSGKPPPQFVTVVVAPAPHQPLGPGLQFVEQRGHDPVPGVEHHVGARHLVPHRRRAGPGPASAGGCRRSAATPRRHGSRNTADASTPLLAFRVPDDVGWPASWLQRTTLAPLSASGGVNDGTASQRATIGRRRRPRRVCRLARLRVGRPGGHGTSSASVGSVAASVVRRRLRRRGRAPDHGRQRDAWMCLAVGLVRLGGRQPHLGLSLASSPTRPRRRRRGRPRLSPAARRRLRGGALRARSAAAIGLRMLLDGVLVATVALPDRLDARSCASSSNSATCRASRSRCRSPIRSADIADGDHSHW